MGQEVVQLVGALHYKLEGRRFDSGVLPAAPWPRVGSNINGYQEYFLAEKVACA